MIKLHHYSDFMFAFDPNREYRVTGVMPLKPEGLWLSDDTDRGWFELCLRRGLDLEKLAHVTEITIDSSRVLGIHSKEDVEHVKRQYREKSFGELNLDWAKIKQKYSGVFVSPFVREGADMYPWYWAFDCSSACIWDLSVVKELRASRLSTPHELSLGASPCPSQR